MLIRKSTFVLLFPYNLFDMGDIPVRKSCDKTFSHNGKNLLNFCKVYSVVIMNGRCGSDLNGSFTYISAQGCSLIDCVLCSPDLLPFVLDFDIETRTKSKHLPYSAIFKNDLLQDINTPENRSMNNTRDESRTKYDFSDKNRYIFKQNLGNLFTNERTLHFISRIEDNTVSTGSIANMFVSCLCDASIQYTVKIKRKSNEPWFDQTCISPKRDKYRLLRKFRTLHSDGDRDAYLRARNCFKQTCAAKKTDYRAVKLDDLISSVNDQKSVWSKLKK